MEKYAKQLRLDITLHLSQQDHDLETYAKQLQHEYSDLTSPHHDEDGLPLVNPALPWPN